MLADPWLKDLQSWKQYLKLVGFSDFNLVMFVRSVSYVDNGSKTVFFIGVISESDLD